MNVEPRSVERGAVPAGWLRPIHLACLLLCLARPVAAGASGKDPGESARLAARLDPATATSVGEMVDQARKAGLPTGSLVATALEGATRGVPGERIVSAVRSQLAALETARQGLGPRSAEPEIVAGATAVRAGVPADSLARLRAAREGSLVIPLVVMADMVARGVPPAAASLSVTRLVRAGVRDADLVRLREHVAGDIRAGAPPREAAAVRTQALMVGSSDAGGRSNVPKPRIPGGAP